MKTALAAVALTALLAGSPAFAAHNGGNTTDSTGMSQTQDNSSQKSKHKKHAHKHSHHKKSSSSTDTSGMSKQ